MLMDNAGVDLVKDIFSKVGMVKGKLPGFEIFGNRVLVATYERPEKTKSGLYIPEQSRDEEANQGKACLILALGPTAFKSDAQYDFVGQSVEVGDWVSLRVYTSKPIIINGYPCRIVRDQDIELKIPSPDIIY